MKSPLRSDAVTLNPDATNVNVLLEAGMSKADLCSATVRILGIAGH